MLVAFKLVDAEMKLEAKFAQCTQPGWVILSLMLLNIDRELFCGCFHVPKAQLCLRMRNLHLNFVLNNTIIYESQSCFYFLFSLRNALHSNAFLFPVAAFE